MTSTPFPDKSPIDSRLFDLMVKQATEGLSETEQRELQQLSGDYPGEPERIELTVAATELAMNEQFGADQASPVVPDSLRQRLNQDAERFFSAPSNHTGGKSLDSTGQPGASGGSRLTPVSTIGRPVTKREILAIVIAAACLLLVFTGLNPMAWDVTGGSKVAATPQQRLNALLASPPDDLIRLDWIPVNDANVSGQVVWSDQQQTGFMVFKDLDANDPRQRQYQLWVFDTDEDQKYPVDGGVFNIANAGQRSVIPIDARIPVDKAVQFAITVERPGGVVVSERETIPALAKLNP